MAWMPENDIADTAKIWHYTNLLALLSIFQRRQLCFVRLSKQERDPLEGRANPPSNVGHWRLLEENVRLGWCHCWCIDQDESDLMWARVSKGHAVAIESTVGRLKICFAMRYAETYVGQDKVKIWCGKVAYGNDPQPLSLIKYAFRKRLRFHGEQEYRVYISHEGEDDKEQSVTPERFVDIEPMALIEKIWVPPDTSDWEVGVLQNLLGLKGYGLPNLQVSRRPVEPD